MDDDNKDSKRKKGKQDDEEEYRKERGPKRARSRSRSPAERREKDSRRKRRHSRSESPEKRSKTDRRREEEERKEKEPEVKKEAPVRKNKETDMLNTRTGGAYIPPARLRMMQAQITDKSSMAYQRLAWEALKKSIHGYINKINVGNIGVIIKELLKENIVRGRGLLCRSVIQAQAASPTFTNVYAALVAAVNSRFPNIGELLLKRLVIQFKRGFKRNDKAICISSASFIAHLVNQRVAHEILALELLTLLVESPTDDSVEVAIAFLKECGQKLTEVSSKGCNAIFEMLRNILHEGQLDKRVQYMIEVMFQVWKDGFKDHPAVVEELELVPEEEQFTHLLMLDDATDPMDILNVFKHDEKYEENEQKYKTLSKEILGSDADSDDEDGSGESGSEDDEEEEEETTEEQKMTIIDNTETNLVALRRTIYLTINSSLDFEECAHKLMKMQLKPGQEIELCHMFLDCCAEQRTYEKFYGLLAQRFCNINKIYIGPFEEIFKDSYSTAHRLDTNRLRNVSKFFAHLLFTDSISWEVLECVKLNEEDTTSSSRIYIKILFQELAEYMGLKKLNDRLKDPMLQEAFQGVFPRDNPKNTRFSINFFTSIGLGGLTDELREHLKQMPKNVPPPVTEINLDSESSSDSSSDSSDSSSDSSDSSSPSEEEGDSSKKKKKKDKKSKESKKKSKEKNEDKEPETPKEPEPEKNVERWGHDGFYDTYGKDARRADPRQQQKDGEFVRPFDRRPNRPDDRRNRDERNSDNRQDDRRRNDREDERRRDDRNEDRGDSRKKRDDRDARRDDDYRSRKEDDRSRREEDRPRREDDRPRREEERPRREEDSSRKEEDRSRRDDDRSRRDQNRSRGDENRSRREENRSREEDERPRREENRSRGEDERLRKEENRSRGDDERPRRDEVRSRDEERSRSDENGSRRDEERSRRDEERPRRDNRDDDRSRRDDDRPRREENRPRREEERSRKEESRREDSEDDRKKRNKKSKRDDKNADLEEDSRSKSKKGKDKKKKKRDSDSENDSRSRKRGKENRNKDSSESSSSDSDSSSSSSDSSDDGRSKKRDKRKDKNRSKKEDEGWDIRRASSIRREVAVGRYWDN